MKAYKAVEAHNNFASSWVKSLSARMLHDDKVIMIAEVKCVVFS